jgi:hypothetical protein
MLNVRNLVMQALAAVVLAALLHSGKAAAQERVRIVPGISTEREINLGHRTLERYLQTRLEALGFTVEIGHYSPDQPQPRRVVEVQISILIVETNRYDVAAAFFPMNERGQNLGLLGGFDWYQAHAIVDLDQAAREIAEAISSEKDWYYRP